jgi:hypothetical protein
MHAEDQKPDPLTALWQQIRERLPKCVRDDPKTPGRIGFLLGLGAGSLASRIARRILGLNAPEA